MSDYQWPEHPHTRWAQYALLQLGLLREQVAREIHARVRDDDPAVYDLLKDLAFHLCALEDSGTELIGPVRSVRAPEPPVADVQPAPDPLDPGWQWQQHEAKP